MSSIQIYFKNPSGEAHFEIALETTERGYTEITHNHEFQVIIQAFYFHYLLNYKN